MPIPDAYLFELASFFNKTTGEYSGWNEMVQFDKPNVPPGSVRNLRPLFAGDPISETGSTEKMGNDMSQQEK